MTDRSPFARSIAVVIGINTYGSGIPALRTAANDARRLGALLRDGHGYDVTLLLDADANLASLTELFTRTLPATVKDDDRVLFYFAGHGVARDGDEGPNGYLLPSDARRGEESTYLHMPLVHDALLALPCRHMLVVLDSCFSGAFRWSGTRDAEVEEEIVYKEKYERFVRTPAWQVITSAAQDQKALDQLSAGALGSRDGEGAHSPFALALFDALDGKGDLVPDGKGDGLVTATELYLYLDEKLQNAVEAAGKSQTPRLWPLKKHDKGEYVFFVPGRELALQNAPPLTFDSNPWRGLASYESASANLFFGRDVEIAALRAKIETLPLTVVLGASGTGKSSLVKAGLLPKLAADGWLVLPIVRPGSTPLVALAQALAGPTDTTAAVTPDRIAQRAQRLLDTNPGKKVVLVVDQFEELITLVRTAAERDQTLALLAQLITAHADRLRVVLTIRTDFEPNFDRAAFGEQWRAGRFVVPPMSRENLKAVIEKPAAARVLYFEPSKLVETLLDEVVATPGALPLLSFALTEMYILYVKRQSLDRAITQADYDALGGVVGALRARAESEYEAFDSAHRATLRRVMLRLVTAEGGGLARRRVMDAELDFADAGEQTRAAAVVKRLTDARLLVEGKEPDGDAFVEPAHDALVRGWGRLLQWVREENETKFPHTQQQRLSRAAEDWHRADKGARSGLLWSDASRSAQLSPLVRRKVPWLNSREMAFAKRSVRGRWIAMGTAAAAVLMIAVAGVIAVIGGRRASARAEQVRVGAVVRTASAMVTEDPLLARLLLGSLDSATVHNADDATRLSILGVATALHAQPRVLATFGAVGEEMTAADISRDGTRVVTAISVGQKVRVWNSDGSGAPLDLPGVPGVPQAVVFSHDGTLVAAGGEEGWLQVWHVDGSVPPRVVPARVKISVIRVEFSPDDRRVLIVYDDHRMEILDLNGSAAPFALAGATGIDPIFGADGSQLLMTPEDEGVVYSLGLTLDSTLRSRVLRRFPIAGNASRVAISPDRRRVAMGSWQGPIRIYPLETNGKPLSIVSDSGPAVAWLSWSADGTRLVSTNTESVTEVWDAVTGRQLDQMRRIEEPMQSAEFSPDMRHIVTTSPYNYQALVWTMGNELPVALAGQTQRLVNAIFARDDRHLLTASFDGSARFWELPPEPFYSPRAQQPSFDDRIEHGHSISASAFSPDSRWLAVGNNNGDVWLFRTDSTGHARRLHHEILPVEHLVFSPDGATLYALGRFGDRTVWQLFPLDSGARILPQETPPDTGAMIMRAIGANGRVAVGFLDDASAQLFRFDSVVPRRPLTRHNSDQGCMAFTDDGARMADCEADSTVHVRRVDGIGGDRIIRRAGAVPTGVSFSHDGTQLAIGFVDGTIRVFGAAAADTGQLLTGHVIRVRELAFARDDGMLLSNSDDGTVRLWDLRGTRPTVTLRPRGALIADARFLPDGRRVVTLGANELDVRIWNVDATGGFVAVPVGGATIQRIDVSPDGRWLLASTDKATAALFSLDPEEAVRPFRRIAAACLTVDDRTRYLMEPAKTAGERQTACERARQALTKR